MTEDQKKELTDAAARFALAEIEFSLASEAYADAKRRALSPSVTFSSAGKFKDPNTLAGVVETNVLRKSHLEELDRKEQALEKEKFNIGRQRRLILGDAVDSSQRDTTISDCAMDEKSRAMRQQIENLPRDSKKWDLS